MQVDRLVIGNDVAELRRMTDWLLASGTASGIARDLVFNLDVCANEAVANIISYAYEDDKHHVIALELNTSAQGACLTIRDDGRPFNLLEVPVHQQPTSLADAKVGGLGVHLIRHLMSKCAYRRENGSNVLVLEMYATTAAKGRGADRRKPQTRGLAIPPVFPYERRRNNDRRRNGFISNLQLFATIPYEAVEAVLVDCATRDVAPGTVLLAPGQINNTLHLLISGRLRVHLDRVDSSDYIPIEAGGCFGELSIIDGRPVSAFVVAEVASRVLLIHENVFWQRLIPYPGVARNLLTVLSERMRQDRDIIVDQLKDKLALEHLQKEIAIAQQLQLSMLPAGDALFRDRPELQAYAIMEPAKNVGGDFYDAFLASADRLFVAVGDVSGKGIPAALFMARTITQLRMEAVRRRSPTAVLEAVNRALCEGNDSGMFVTLFCGMLETDTGKFSYVNAGHNPPLFLAADGTARFLKVRKGLVAGVIDRSRYPVSTCHLAADDTLLLYTDGVTEGANTDNELYTEERLLASVHADKWHDPRSLIEAIRANMAEFSGTAAQADDITMLALRFLGTRAAHQVVGKP